MIHCDCLLVPIAKKTLILKEELIICNVIDAFEERLNHHRRKKGLEYAYTFLKRKIGVFNEI